MSGSTGAFIVGYISGLAVALIIVTVNQKPVTAYNIQKAEEACVENKGLKEITRTEYRCINGAVFEKGEGK